MESKIQFKQQRALGAILTDTFKFVRLTWKTLGGLILRIAGPALAVLILSFIFYMQSTLGLVENIGFDNGAFGSNTFGITLLLSATLMIFSVILYYGLLHGTILYSIKSYMNNDGVIQKSEVIANVKNKFWSLLGLSFLSSLIIGVGFIFCVIPAFYFGVVLAPCFAIFVFERRTVSDSISHCFNLIKEEFWMTFAVLLVSMLLYYFLSTVFSIPQYIYFFIKEFVIAETVTFESYDNLDWGDIALNSFALLGQYLSYSLIAIVSGFIYFDLNEKKNFTGTLETIEAIGNRDSEDV